MKARPTGSIEARLVVALLAGLGVLIVGGSVGLWMRVAAEARDDFDATLTAEGRAVASLVAVDGNGLHLHYAEEVMTQFSPGADPLLFEIHRRDGTLLEASVSIGSARLGPPTLPAAAETLADAVLPGGVPARAVTLLVAPLRSEAAERASPPGWVEELPVTPATALAYVTVARSRTSLARSLARLRWGLCAWALGMLGASAAVVVGAVRWGFRPVRRAAAELELVDAGTLDRRLDEHTLPRELRPFVGRVNDLLGRLERSFERERDFSASVAHELRTPLAELRALCDVAMATPGNPPNVAEFFADARDVGLGMERIVEALLALRASEPGGAAVHRQAFGLRAALEQSWQPLAALAAERGLRLRFDCPGDAVVETDREKVQLLFSNLLSNAVHHAPRGSTVEVRGRVIGGRVELTIGNPAPELVEDDVARIFDRFWRKTTARENDGHLGLGLALAASLGRALGLDLRAELTRAHALELSLRLPLAAF